MSKIKNIESLNKRSKEILFLREVKNKSRDEIKSLYFEKYKLNERSNNINLRIFERLLGEYYKYSNEKKDKVKKELKSELVKVNIDYKELVDNLKILKEKLKRSNRVNNNIIEIDNIKEI